MKLPIFSLNIFKKPTKKRQPSTNLGKRRISNASSVQRTRRASSSRRPRKRSITYYAPSKSKLYPTEYFPSSQQGVPKVTALPPLSPHFQLYAEPPPPPPPLPSSIPPPLPPVISIPTKKPNFYPSMVRSYTPKQTYLCDEYDHHHDVIIHQPPMWYLQQLKLEQNANANADLHHRISTASRMPFDAYKPNAKHLIGPTSGELHGKYLLHDADSLDGGDKYPFIDAKEFGHGVSMPVPVVEMATAHAVDSSSKYSLFGRTTATYGDRIHVSPTKSANNRPTLSQNSLAEQCVPSSAYQSISALAAPQHDHLFVVAHDGQVPVARKLDRHRRRKVS